MDAERWQKVREIFHAALGREPSARASFLDEVCGEQTKLRREVESLLSSYDEAKSFLETPAIGNAEDLTATKRLHVSNGARFGHYEIVRQIGAGGMGEVYLARDVKLDRRVAVKILNERFARHESNLARFTQEAKSASALNHPNILTIYEIGESNDGHFIVSEYVEGETLREALNHKTLPLAETLNIAVQIANALTAAHAAKIIHRDIKPENIIVRPDGLTKILDFGLAKLIEQNSAGSEDETIKQNQTAKGTILGTVNYMSPEQARGKKIDARTDIFSFGVVLYEMLAGKLPFAGETTGDAISAILTKEPAPLSRFDVPKDLDRIVGKALRKNADERYQHIKDLLIDVQDFKQELEFQDKLQRTAAPHQAEGETQIINAAVTDTPRAVSSAEYLSGNIKKRKISFAVGTAVLLLAAIGLGYWFFFGRSANTGQIESIAVMPFQNESGNADVEYLSDGMTETLIGSLSQIPKLNVKARSSVFRYKGKDANANTVGKELNVQAVLIGRVVQRGQDLILYVELVDAATENILWKQTYNKTMTNLVALQTDIARDVADKLKIKLSGADEQRLAKNDTANPEAYQLYLKGRFHWNRRTRKDSEKALEYFNQAIAVDPNYALAYVGVAEVYMNQQAWRSPPRETMSKAREAARKALTLDDNSAEAHTAFGRVLNAYDWDFAGAEREYRRAIELNPNYANAHYWYGQLLMTQSRWEESFAEYRRALELEPLSLIINTNYAGLLVHARRYTEAIAHLEKTLELDENFVPTYGTLTRAYRQTGNYPESVETFAREWEIDGEPEIAALSRASFARSGWEGFLRYVTEDRRAARSFYTLASFHTALGERDKAFIALNKSYEEREAPLVRLKVDPLFDPLRDDARYQELLKKIGFPP